MASGKIISIRNDRGYGFIGPDSSAQSSSDIFFHHSSVAAGTFDDLREGDAVEFDVEPDPRDSSRLRATNVSPAQATAAG